MEPIFFGGGAQHWYQFLGVLRATLPAQVGLAYNPAETNAARNGAFVRKTRERLGMKARELEVIGADGSYELRESETPYEADFGLENEDLRQENTFYWDVSV